MIGIILGILSILYFCIIVYHTHLNAKFPIFWLVLGVLLIGAGKTEDRIESYLTILPLWVLYVFFIMSSLVAIIAFYLFIRILRYFSCKVEKNLSYIIVLGAQMKPKGPSLSLQRRLDCAAEYLNKNEHTIAILSGGQGSNEPVTEAEGMRRYLISIGVNEKRLLLENTSVNTYENLLFSKKVIAGNEKTTKKEQNGMDLKIGIVTSNFHIFRAIKIAKKQGYQNIYAIPSQTEPYMLITAITREIIAICKDFICNNL